MKFCTVKDSGHNYKLCVRGTIKFEKHCQSSLPAKADWPLEHTAPSCDSGSVSIDENQREFQDVRLYNPQTPALVKHGRQ
jgi:hypothetical protein